MIDSATLEAILDTIESEETPDFERIVLVLSQTVAGRIVSRYWCPSQVNELISSIELSLYRHEI